MRRSEQGDSAIDMDPTDAVTGADRDDGETPSQD